jgi:hypothetical protein
MLYATTARYLGERIWALRSSRSYSRLLMIEQILHPRARGADVAIKNGAAGADPVDRASAEEIHTMAPTGRPRAIAADRGTRGDGPNRGGCVWLPEGERRTHRRQTVLGCPTA